MKTLTTVICIVFICAILFFGYLGYQQVNKKLNEIDFSRVEIPIVEIG